MPALLNWVLGSAFVYCTLFGFGKLLIGILRRWNPVSANCTNHGRLDLSWIDISMKTAMSTKTHQSYISNTLDHSCNRVSQKLIRRLKEVAQRYKGGNSVNLGISPGNTAVTIC